MPVSLGARDAQSKAIGDGDFHNKVSAMIAELLVGLTDPVGRLPVISYQMADLKDSDEAVAAEALISLTGFAPQCGSPSAAEWRPESRSTASNP